MSSLTDISVSPRRSFDRDTDAVVTPSSARSVSPAQVPSIGRESLKSMKRVLVKLGSSVITNKEGSYEHSSMHVVVGGTCRCATIA